MLTVVTQNQEFIYRVRYFHLNHDEETDLYQIVGFDDDSRELVNLGIYNFYRQAIDTFAAMDYEDNDLFYYKTNSKRYVMPENITDERECIRVYGSTY